MLADKLPDKNITYVNTRYFYTMPKYSSSDIYPQTTTNLEPITYSNALPSTLLHGIV
jgi:hypothetical protein